MQLTYRAQTFTCTPTPHRFIRPGAVNWRYQVPGEVAEPISMEVPYKPLTPKAINWRYQLPAGI